jgi:DNA polymerase-3 subunit epsilon
MNSQNCTSIDLRAPSIPLLPPVDYAPDNTPIIPGSLERYAACVELARAWLCESAVVIDTETTGMGPDDEIIEIAIVGAVSGERIFESLIKPSCPVRPGARDVHGISDAMLASAPTFVEIQADLEKHLSGRLLLAYNCLSDERMIIQSSMYYRAKRRDWFCNVDPMPVGWVASRCIMELYAFYFGDWDRKRSQYRWQKLETAAHRHALSIFNQQHRAMADAQLARSLLWHLANEVQP